MATKVYTCNVFFENKSGFYNSVDNPEKLAKHFDDKGTNWKYLNVYEKDKMGVNKCGTYLRRIYSQKYLMEKEHEKEK
ncbi:hypothetical protein NZD88_21075 [Chryseobacterium antibioticum]|uniref:DUF4177 domain-containing protein n=1 Tax=Chryseobacterium pyrolae TaxID=2987481 RepID=A0ABT2ING6_9FLAO|nr:hypothetical protein [Chryseobacterium pyrolae]MCT2410057.1 hypothetical protein [Chryseobacterium pyrolae]